MFGRYWTFPEIILCTHEGGDYEKGIRCGNKNRYTQKRKQRKYVWLSTRWVEPFLIWHLIFPSKLLHCSEQGWMGPENGDVQYWPFWHHALGWRSFQTEYNNHVWTIMSDYISPAQRRGWTMPLERGTCVYCFPPYKLCFISESLIYRLSASKDSGGRICCFGVSF